MAEVAELRVRLTPRAAREDLTVDAAGAIAARVTAPPVDGRANTALERLVARRLDVPPSRVTVVRGASARHKVVRVEGLAQGEAEDRLAAG
ncbi:unannotated protein [freshwater metagenome]|uniref:Unannotated protein n=1 Tax=freshwater metagenome TaxID=449393 RepID=A0A6J7IU94_9ZZZZ